MTLDDYQYLLAIARQQTRVANEAEDLLQDALLIAAEQGRLDLDTDENRKWITGVIRNRAKMQARTAVRRKTRDSSYSTEKQILEEQHQFKTPDGISSSNLEGNDASNKLLAMLSPANRTVAILSLHGLASNEICAVLNISNTAFRQRLTSIRRALGPLQGALQQEAVAMAYASRHQRGREEDADLPLGLLRRALMHQLKTLNEKGIQSIGTYDPSGHLIVFEQKS